LVYNTSEIIKTGINLFGALDPIQMVEGDSVRTGERDIKLNHPSTLIFSMLMPFGSSRDFGETVILGLTIWSKDHKSSCLGRKDHGPNPDHVIMILFNPVSFSTEQKIMITVMQSRGRIGLWRY
jgi:hypothetical protein